MTYVGPPTLNMLHLLPGPVCGHRSNNPHPKVDFLMPKNLVQQDKEQMLRSRVTEAVHQYMDKMIRTGRDPLKEMEQPRRSKTPMYSTSYNRGEKLNLTVFDEMNTKQDKSDHGPCVHVLLKF
jgi:hypothetical protein